MTRLLISLILSLVLASTSVTAAVMQARMHGAVDLVICSDSRDASGMAVITLDASGKPIDGMHRCPDCLAAASPVLLPAALAVPFLVTSGRGLDLPPQLHGTGSQQPQAAARGPPAFA